MRLDQEGSLLCHLAQVQGDHQLAPVERCRCRPCTVARVHRSLLQVQGHRPRSGEAAAPCDEGGEAGTA